MSLKLLLGGSGSGKTHRLYTDLIEESIKDPDRNYFAIVPEQFTMQTQKEIVTLHPRHGVMNIDIVGFQRLAYRVFEELAIISPDVLDDMGKSMILRKVTGGKQRELPLYRSHLSQNGFIGQLKSMLSELYQYGITPKMLNDRLMETDSPMLRQKLQDLSVIYKAFQEYIKDRYITTEEILDVLCRHLNESRIIRDSVITLDGYTGFTPVQYRLLDLLLRYGRRVIVTVTMDPAAAGRRKGGIQELFHMSREMMERLRELAIRNQVPLEEAVVLDAHPSIRYRREMQGFKLGEAGKDEAREAGKEIPAAQSAVLVPALDFLEQNLYRYKGRTYPGPAGEIHLIQASSPAEEISYVVRQIQGLLRQGFRYRDMAVITGDLGSFGNELAYQFGQEAIPYFLDDKKSILKNPMVELIRAALEAIRKNFSYEAMFRYLRTGLVTEKEDEMVLDRLENYVIAMGIKGRKRWNWVWEGWYRGGKELNLDELNRFRERLMEPLTELSEAFREEGRNVGTMTAAVIRLLDALQAEQKMADREKEFKEEGEAGLSREYGQAYGLVMELFDRLIRLLGDEVVSVKEYAQILDAGFSEIRVGFIPASVDRIMVGDITRTRLDHIKYLFFIGVNDGIVPQKKENSSLFTDREREYLRDHHVELAPTVREEGFRQRFYLYLALTKPERGLFLSFSIMDGTGHGLRPSILIGELRKLFPKVSVTIPKEDVGVPFTVREAKGRLIGGLRTWERAREDLEFLELFRHFIQSKEQQAGIKRLVEAAFYAYDKKGIGKMAARALYGQVLGGSVTRLEKYASCAYAHFLSYGLELLERQEYELAAVDIGNLFHDSIDLCFERIREEGGDFKGLNEEERKALVHSCVAKVTQEYGNTILQSSARNAYLARKVEAITDRTVWALTEQLKKGDFIPSGFEVSFSAADGLKAMEIPLSEEEALHLRGRIDRLDLCEDEEHVYVKIIDYKSGGTTFDLAALYYGLQLQLVVYLDAAMELEERKNPDKSVVPAGIFYYNINDPVIEREGLMTPETVNRRILRELRMNGLVNSQLEVIRHLDHEIETESDVIPVAMKDGYVKEARSSVAGGSRFDALRSYVREKLRAEGREILDGCVSASPFKQGARTACDYCPYHAVCGFDLKTSGYGYRKFKPMKSEEIWPEIEGDEAGAEGGMPDGD